MTQGELLELLKTDAAATWPRIWGHVYAHRRACLHAVLDAVDSMLADDSLTRGRFRKRLETLVRSIEEQGPSALHG